MLEITPQRRRELRAKAHHLDAVVSIGQQGLTPRVMHEIDTALKAHELVKVRVFDDDRSRREAMLGRIAEELSAAPVQHLGKLLILWRPAPPDDGKPADPAARKPVARRRTVSRERSRPPAAPAAQQRRSGPAAPPRRRRASTTGATAAAAARPSGNASRRRRRPSDR